MAPAKKSTEEIQHAVNLPWNAAAYVGEMMLPSLSYIKAFQPFSPRLL